jgi:predicted PhzF superfamily epimerase YddE/YHI9
VVEFAPPPHAPPPAGHVTLCRTWPLGERRAAVRCWTPGGRPIDCCGHGLLGCAMLWSRRWKNGGTLVSGQISLPTRSDGELHWIGFPGLAVRPANAADFSRGQTLEQLESLIGAPLANCAVAGGSQGYLIAELVQDDALSKLRPPGAALGNATERALIVTSRSSHSADRIEFRYFAPQYGVSEDSATGSAMRVLASYWQHRGLGEALEALQLSPAGGLLRSAIEGGITWVGGIVLDE